MLPRRLCEDLCSLNPHKVIAIISIIIYFSHHAGKTDVFCCVDPVSQRRGTIKEVYTCMLLC